MIASFADEGQETLPAPFGHALNALAEQRTDVVGLTADLGKYADMHVFAEQNPIGSFRSACPRSCCWAQPQAWQKRGLVQFAATYSVFATRRAFDFPPGPRRAGINVNVVGALPA